MTRVKFTTCPKCGHRAEKLTHAERSLIQKAALSRAKAKGVHVGRPLMAERQKVIKLFKKYKTISRVARELGITRWTVRDELNKSTTGSKPEEGK